MRAGSVAAGTRGSSRPTTVTSCRSQLPGRASRCGASGSGGSRRRAPRERIGVEMLDPAIVGERLERRHAPVLRSCRRPDPEHHRRSDAESRCPRSSRPRGSARHLVPPPANGSQPRQSTWPAPGASPATAAPPDTATSTAASATPSDASACVARPEHDRRPEDRLPSASAPSERACASSRRTAGKPTPRATAAATTRGAPDAAPRAASSARQNATTTTSPWSVGEVARIERRLHGGRVAEPVPRVTDAPRWGHVLERDRERRRGRDRDAGREAHCASAQERGERAPGAATTRTRPTTRAPRGATRHTSTTATAGAAASSAPDGQPLSQRPSPGGRRAPRRACVPAAQRPRAPLPRRRAGAEPATSCVGGRPAYVGASSATSALERPTAARATSASATTSGRPVTTTSSGTAPTALAARRAPAAASARARLDCGERVERELPVAAHASGRGGRPARCPDRRGARGATAAHAPGRCPPRRGRRRRGSTRRAARRPIAASTSRTTAMLSRGASSSSRTMSSPAPGRRRPVDGPQRLALHVLAHAVRLEPARTPHEGAPPAVAPGAGVGEQRVRAPGRAGGR